MTAPDYVRPPFEATNPKTAEVPPRFPLGPVEVDAGDELGPRNVRLFERRKNHRDRLEERKERLEQE